MLECSWLVISVVKLDVCSPSSVGMWHSQQHGFSWRLMFQATNNPFWLIWVFGIVQGGQWIRIHDTIYFLSQFDILQDVASVTKEQEFIFDFPVRNWWYHQQCSALIILITSVIRSSLVLKSLFQSWFLPSSREDWDQDWFLYFTQSIKTGLDPIGPVHISYMSPDQGPTTVCY